MMNQLSLDGTWKLRWSDGQRGRPEYAERPETDEARYIDAAVPGEVHLDLLRAGLIADPYVRAQARESRWVEDCVWSYRRFFDVPEDALGGRAWLCFQMLDYTAKIVLNGETVGTHGNVFRPCRVEVTGKLRAGRNLLTVHLDAGLIGVSEKPHTGYVFQGFDQHLHKRHWLRKPQNQFGWDWSPRLVNIGIGGEVTLEWTEAAVRLEEFAAVAELNAELDTGTVRGRFFLERLHGSREAVVSLRLDDGPCVEAVVKLDAEQVCSEVVLNVSNPRLWWPVGHGAQELYTLRGEVSVDGRRVAEVTRRVGFRRVRVNQEPHPESGQHFVFEINGRPIFLKGANFVPADLIYARLDAARYRALVEEALAANFNFLRVWGGGLYESDAFYDLCDERGIVVWQEFIYACGKYPLQDETFYTEAKREAVHQVRRLSSRPSLIAWCGNNEIDMFNDWSISEVGVVRPDYGFFHFTLRQIVGAEHPGCYYQPSSPFSPDPTLSPNSDVIGDQHPWSIGFHDVDFHKYRPMVCRFPNEGGFLGPTSLPTTLSCLPEGQRHVQSFAWQYHDNSVDSWGEPSPVDAITQEWLGRDVRSLSVEEFVYWAGLIQGEALREYIEAFRRKMFGSACACFWMFNDCWPAVRSWTIIDYNLRRTPAFHAVRKAFAPVHVVLAQEAGEIRVYGINEGQETRTLDLRSGVFTLAGDYRRDEQNRVTLAPNAATCLAAWPADGLGIDMGAFTVLSDETQTVARNRLFLSRFKEMIWPQADVTVALADGMARFSSPVFVWGVCLDLAGEIPLEDNFFDLYPGVEHLVPWPQAEPPRILHVGNDVS